MSESRQSLRVLALVAPLVLLAAVSSCKREERALRVSPPEAGRIETKRVTDLSAGPTTSPAPTPLKNAQEENAFALNEGKRLFQNFNCSGCHANGGGGMGPPLIDDKWLYGSEPDQVFATIVEGRPNGMPSFRGKIPDFQVWQLSAYVRSMSGQVSKITAPSRSDHMNAKPPENSTDREQPKNSGLPKSAEMPQ